MTQQRTLPPDIADRLIVALDVGSVEAAETLVAALDGTATFFKIGLWLLLQPGIDRLIDALVGAGKHVFLDYKMYDIGETVRRGVESVARRGVSFVTVHGDPDILQAAVAGRGASPLKIFAVSVLTSLDDAALKTMGYAGSVRELVELRVRNAAAAGCDGVIASPTDRPDDLRRLAGADHLLIATPGIRLPDDTQDDHARAGTPAEAIRNGADYLVVGRPILRAASPREKVASIIAEMRRGAELRAAG